MTGTHNNRKRDAKIVQHAPIPPKLLFVPQLRQPIFIFDVDWYGLLHFGREDNVIFTREDGQKAWVQCSGPSTQVGERKEIKHEVGHSGVYGLEDAACETDLVISTYRSTLGELITLGLK